ncbi:hypothetical protein Mapa_015421 [Marchantia paleacea]|nr:hypothetical protein Mapa_015421 [Marchantia paleacea]
MGKMPLMKKGNYLTIRRHPYYITVHDHKANIDIWAVCPKPSYFLQLISSRSKRVERCRSLNDHSSTLRYYISQIKSGVLNLRWSKREIQIGK